MKVVRNEWGTAQWRTEVEINDFMLGYVMNYIADYDEDFAEELTVQDIEDIMSDKETKWENIEVDGCSVSDVVHDAVFDYVTENGKPELIDEDVQDWEMGVAR